MSDTTTARAALSLDTCDCPSWCDIEHTIEGYIEDDGWWHHSGFVLDTPYAAVTIERQQRADGSATDPIIYTDVRHHGELTPDQALQFGEAVTRACGRLSD